MILESQEKILRELYAAYHKKVLRTIYKMVRNQEDAEEILQNVFVDVYAKMHSFKQQSSVNIWIYRIAINKPLSCLKKKSRKKRFAWLTSLFDSESGALIHDHTDNRSPEHILEDKEGEMLVFRYINDLPERQKSAFLLAQIEQLSYEEIAKEMDISVSSVESLLFRAKQTLKTKLGKYYKHRVVLKETR
ncbi:MAG: sigma-70 family RNA polymerase sigma factor [Cytophagales bacterium]|nr:sigma-70 family RNA polymerase sigma factor [Cytophaga sp.]